MGGGGLLRDCCLGTVEPAVTVIVFLATFCSILVLHLDISGEFCLFGELADTICAFYLSRSRQFMYIIRGDF